MKYDFDEIIDRRNTYSIKYDAASRGKPEGILPLWVADMDFKAPECVVDALTQCSRHGIYGYSDSDERYFDTLKSWFSRRFGWEIDSSWLVKTPGIVNAIHIAVRALTEPGDSILIQQPVYYPFASAVVNTGRSLVVNELLYQNLVYTIDFDDFESKIAEYNVKLFILCNPHNPVGRVWTREELTRMGDICLRYGVTVVSDEIHQDFIYMGHRHQVFADISPVFRDITITCTAPSKTFNMAGLMISNIFIPNHDIRREFKAEYARSGLSQIGIMGLAACQAAYEGGEEWLTQLLSYLTGNLSYIRDFLKTRLPEIGLVTPEGTYLLWLDFREMGIGDRELDDIIVHKAGLWLDDGPMFGAGGQGFQRINMACPRAVLREAMARLAKAFETY